MRRRVFLNSTANAVAGAVAMDSVLPRLARAANRQKSRHVILLWMGGGPSQIDTWDLKPRHENGGEFSETSTNVAGVKFSEHFMKLAQHADKLAIVRSLNSKEGDHERGSYFLQTGQKLGGPMRHPALRSLLSQQLADEASSLPPLVTINGSKFLSFKPIGPEFLGPRYQPLLVSQVSTGVPTGEDLHLGTPADFTVASLQRSDGIDDARWERRMELWSAIQGDFLSGRQDEGLRSHRETYLNAVDLMSSQESKAFGLESEPLELRARYGVGAFGQGCLLARRLVEAGVACIQVTLSNSTIGGSTWDSHSQNFPSVRNLSRELDAGFATLLEDLESRGLLDHTTIVCMGEFGRTPKINATAGRDHFPRAFSGVIAGGGVSGGQVYGQTSEDGMTIIDSPVSIPDWLATICSAAGVNPRDTVTDDSGRPIPIVDADPIEDLIA